MNEDMQLLPAAIKAPAENATRTPSKVTLNDLLLIIAVPTGVFSIAVLVGKELQPNINDSSGF